MVNNDKLLLQENNLALCDRLRPEVPSSNSLFTNLPPKDSFSLLEQGKSKIERSRDLFSAAIRSINFPQTKYLMWSKKRQGWKAKWLLPQSPKWRLKIFSPSNPETVPIAYKRAAEFLRSKGIQINGSFESGLIDNEYCLSEMVGTKASGPDEIENKVKQTEPDGPNNGSIGKRAIFTGDENCRDDQQTKGENTIMTCKKSDKSSLNSESVVEALFEEDEFRWQSRPLAYRRVDGTLVIALVHRYTIIGSSGSGPLSDSEKLAIKAWWEFVVTESHNNKDRFSTEEEMDNFAKLLLPYPDGLEWSNQEWWYRKNGFKEWSYKPTKRTIHLSLLEFLKARKRLATATSVGGDKG